MRGFEGVAVGHGGSACGETREVRGRHEDILGIRRDGRQQRLGGELPPELGGEEVDGRHQHGHDASGLLDKVAALAPDVEGRRCITDRGHRRVQLGRNGGRTALLARLRVHRMVGGRERADRGVGSLLASLGGGDTGPRLGFGRLGRRHMAREVGGAPHRPRTGVVLGPPLVPALRAFDGVVQGGLRPLQGLALREQRFEGRPLGVCQGMSLHARQFTREAGLLA